MIKKNNFLLYLRMVKPWFIIFVFVLLAFCACSDTSRKLNKAEDLLETLPDSSLSVLNSINPEDLEYSPGKKARYILLLFEASEHLDEELPFDSLISYAIGYYAESSAYKPLSQAYYHKAHLYAGDRQYDKAIEDYLLAEDYALRAKDKILQARIYNRLGSILNFQENDDTGRAYLKKSVKLFRQTGETAYENDALLNLAYTYTAVADYDSALLFLRQALAQSHDSAFTGRAYQEIGQMYHAGDNFDSAEYYLQKSLHYPMVKYEPAIRNELLAEIYLETGRYDTAQLYAGQALRQLSTYRIKRGCYAVLANAAYVQARHEEYVSLSNKYQEYTDSVNLILKQRRLSDIKETYQLQKAALQYRERSQRTIFVTILVYAVVFALMLYIRRLYKKREQEQMQQSELLQSKQKQLIDEKRKDLCRQLHESIRQLHETGLEKRKRLASQAEKEQHDRDIICRCLHLKNPREPEAFFAFTASPLNKLPHKLKSGYPQLTQDDILLCCLMQLGFTNDKISLIADWKETTMQKRKQRLTVKLGFQGVKNLNSFLDELTNKV